MLISPKFYSLKNYNKNPSKSFNRKINIFKCMWKGKKDRIIKIILKRIIKIEEEIYQTSRPII